MLARLAAWCYRRRWRVLIAWIVILVGVNVVAQTFGGDLLKTFSLPGTESQRTFDVLKQDFARPGDNGKLVYRVKGDGNVHDPEVQQAVLAVANKLAAQPHVLCINTIYGTAGKAPAACQEPGQIAPKNNQIANADIVFDVQSNDVPLSVGSNMRGIVSKANTHQLQVELGGAMFTDQSQPASELIGVL